MMKATICPSVHTDKQLSLTEAAYCAGLLDGEGCLSIVRVKRKESRAGFRYMPLFSIANTNLDLLKAVYGMFGNGRVVRALTTTRLSPNRRDCYTLDLQPHQIRRVLPQLLPYLVGKRRQAELLLELLSIGTPGHILSESEWVRVTELRDTIRRLNQRGTTKPPTPDPPLVLRPSRMGVNQWTKPRESA